MFDWWRSWHGAPTDDRWLVIARRAGVPRIVVPAIVWALLDYASRNTRRGVVSDFDVGAYAEFSGLDPEMIANVLLALGERGFIVKGKFRLPHPHRQGEDRRYLPPNRPLAEEWIITRRIIFERDGYTCRWCGQKGGRLECDHVEPVARGGSHDHENLVTACFKCNRAKRDMSLEQWLAVRGRASQ